MSLTLPRSRYASLSVKDLLDAREAYHTHLVHLEKVVATAIGRYRFVTDDPPSDGREPPPEARGRRDPRTLANSEVRPCSWPCVPVRASPARGDGALPHHHGALGRAL